MARRGPFVQLVERFYERYCGAAGLAMVYGFPGERHMRLGRQLLRYCEPLPVPYWRREAAGGSPADGVEPGRWPSRGESAHRHRLRHGFDPVALDALWRRAAVRYPVAARRDAAWVGPRFTGRPGVEYRHLAAWRHGRLAAYAVVRIEGPVLAWAELVWDGRDPRALAALDVEVARLAAAAGVERCELWLANDPPAEALLAARGWRREPLPGGPLQSAVTFLPNEIDARDFTRRLYVTMADADLV